MVLTCIPKDGISTFVEELMVKRSMGVLLCLLLASVMLRAADSPFTGKWKLNPARSRMTDVKKVKAVGPNKYDFNLGGDTVETIVVDGTEQPGAYGSTLTVTADAPDTWRVERKSKGRTQIVGIWKLSADGKTLTDNFTSYRADGTTFHLDYIYQRTTGGPGFDGTWESTTEDMSSTFEIEIAPNGENGILLDYTTFGMKKSMQFDGKDYPIVGANAPAGYTGSARQVKEHTIKITDKVKDKHIDMQQMELSPDGKTLTFTVSRPNRDKPQIQVFDRE
jgi:hypothetical protein